MGFEKVGSLADLPAGALRQVKAGQQEIALCRVGDELHAVDGICPHLGGPLGHGALHGTALVCPWHAWEFDCVTGEFSHNPDFHLRKFAVKVEEGDIFVDAGTA
ncbi:MAG: Rieske 2Fe-2S domain-containing protein [Bryobacteraceae bacterium]